MPFARAVETRTADRTWPTATDRRRSTNDVDRRHADHMLRRSFERPGLRQSVESHRLERELPLRTPGKKGQASSVADLWRVDRDEKARSVVASSRVPRLAGFAGSPSGCRLELTVYRPLVRTPPTDTRPQARAKLGNERDTEKGLVAQAFSASFLSRAERVNDWKELAKFEDSTTPSATRSGALAGLRARGLRCAIYLRFRTPSGPREA